MKRCRDCHTSDTCRIPEELGRLARVLQVISERGGNPWLEARIEQYMAVDVCLASLFGLADLHAKANQAEADFIGLPAETMRPGNGRAPSFRHVAHRSLALEMTLQHHQHAVA